MTDPSVFRGGVDCIEEVKSRYESLESLSVSDILDHLDEKFVEDMFKKEENILNDHLKNFDSTSFGGDGLGGDDDDYDYSSVGELIRSYFQL